jgi:hypothetical protein
VTPRDLLDRAAAEGATVTLKLRLDGNRPTPETLELLTAHRDALVDHLAAARVGSLDLPPVLIHSLLVWIARYHPLNVTTPQGTQLDATPEQALDALQAPAWCVIADGDGYRLISRGNVPAEVRAGLRELDSGSMFAQPRTEQQTAVVN